MLEKILFKFSLQCENGAVSASGLCLCVSQNKRRSSTASVSRSLMEVETGGGRGEVGLFDRVRRCR